MDNFADFALKNWLSRQRPLSDRKICQVIKPFHRPTNPKNLVKIGTVDCEIQGLEVDH